MSVPDQHGPTVLDSVPPWPAAISAGLWNHGWFVPPPIVSRGAAARAHVERSFDVHVLGRRLGAIYRELSAGRR